jgi:hypothetical protein
MGLAEHYGQSRSEGGDWLGPGKHDVTVSGYETGASTKKGTPFVKFDLTNDEGKARATFWLTPAALKVLAGFAEACGVPREQAAGYDETKQESNRIFLNRQLQVTVKAREGDDGKTYHDVSDWRPLNGTQQVPVAKVADAAGGEVPF